MPPGSRKPHFSLGMPPPPLHPDLQGWAQGSAERGARLAAADPPRAGGSQHRPSLPAGLNAPTGTRCTRQAAQPSPARPGLPPGVPPRTLFPGGSAQAAAPSRSRGFPPRPAPAALAAGTAASPGASSGSSQRRARGAIPLPRRGSRERGMELAGSAPRASATPRPRGAGDPGAHSVSSRPLHGGCRALAPSPGSPHVPPQPWLPDKLPPA